MSKKRRETVMAFALGAYFLLLTWPGLRIYFSADDIMNLYVAWSHGAPALAREAVLFWSGGVRPIGNLFYLAIYPLAGFHPLPFRIVTFLFLLANLWLLYRLLVSLTRSSWIALIGALFTCFHAALWPIFTNTGTIYDILCQTFMLSAVGMYAGIRGEGKLITWKQSALLALLSVAAIDAKEMSVALPVILLGYEMLLPKTKGLARWRGVAAVGLVTVLFLIGRFAGSNALTGNPAYEVNLTLNQYLVGMQNYLDWLAGRARMPQTVFTSWAPLVALLAALVAAGALRSRLMIFGWLYFVAALLPLGFAPPRLGYVLYIPYTGCAIYIAGLCAAALRWLMPVRVAAACVFVCAIEITQILQQSDLVARREEPSRTDEIRAMAEDVSRAYPQLRKGARLLLINDSFGEQQYRPMFVLGLRYHDLTLEADKLHWDADSGPPRIPPGYDHAFLYNGRSYREVKPGEPGLPSFVSMAQDEAALNIVRDVTSAGPDGLSWAARDPQFRFASPGSPALFVMDYRVPGVIVDHAGAVKIRCWIDETQVAAPPAHKEGDYHFEAALPASVTTGQTVHVRFHVENAYRTETGGLVSFQIRRAGLVTRPAP